LLIHSALITVSSLIGGVLYRMRGGWPDLPRPIEQALFCLPILYVSLGTVPVFSAALVYGLSVIVTLKGHGHTMNYSTPVDLSKLEWYEYFTEKLIGKIPDYWYKVIAHSFGGLLITAPLLFSAPHLFWVGGLQGLAYMIGWLMHPNYEDGKIKLRLGKFTLDSATSWGEFLTGALIWGFLMGGVNVG